MLVVRQRRETVAPLPVRQVPELNDGNSKVVEESREGLCVGIPESPFSPPPLPGRVSDPALLEFLEDTRVGTMPGLALLGVEEEGAGLDEIELWPGSEGEEWLEGEEGGPGTP